MVIQKPRGTLDVMPEETPLWRFIEAHARERAEISGFGEIRFPTIEYTELFSRGVGGSTDVVQKEMYTFSDRDEERTLTLRPEGTACVARSLIENGRCSAAMPQKLYYLINCFRHEKPQAGRSREFYQFGAEIFGAASPAADVELIELANDLIASLGIKSVSLRINSIGCPECRPAYRAALKEYFESRKSELCETCRGRLETNPLRILDCKSEICSAIAADAPKMIERLCPECREHFDTLCSMLDTLGIKYEIDPMIVRGLDYYTRTVFEFVSNGIGAQSTICGGGRYDGLVSELGGPKLAGIGFAAGITRLILAMKADGAPEPAEVGADIYIAPLGSAAMSKALELACALRRMGIRAESDIVGRSLKAQMKYADKTHARYALIIGESELEKGSAALRSMADSSQRDITLLPEEIAKAISVGE